jgi:hypothetical protein
MATYRRKPKRDEILRTVTPEELERTEEAQRPAERPRPALARHREENWHLSADRRGVPCACDDRTPCLAHAAITGRRRWVRPR